MENIMSFKQLESDWEKVKQIIISNTNQNSKISEVLKDNTFGCQTETLTDIFTILLDGEILYKKSGMCILKNDGGEYFLFLEGYLTICFDDGEMEDYDCDMDDFNFVSKEKATELLNSCPFSIILKIMSYYEENKKKVDSLLKVKKPLSLNQKKTEIQKIISGVDFEIFYEKVMEHVFNLLILKSVPKPQKLKAKKKAAIDSKRIDDLVAKTFEKIKFEDCDDVKIKAKLKDMFTSTLENQTQNPFSGYNKDIVGIVSLFRSFAWSDDNIANFYTKGLAVLSRFHPNLKQLLEVSQLVKPIAMYPGQIVKVNYLIFEDQEFENQLFWCSYGRCLEENSTLIEKSKSIKMDRIFTEYPTMKEVEKFIVSEMEDYWEAGDWEK